MALVCLLLRRLKSTGMDGGHLEGQCGWMLVVFFFVVVVAVGFFLFFFFKELGVLADLLAAWLL